MSEILLGQSYYLRFDTKLWEAMQPYPPRGTLYAASYLRNQGHSVGLFDAMLADSEMEWGQALDRERPRFAVLYEDNFNYLAKMCLLRMRVAAFTMIAMARERGCTVIVAGPDATDHAEEYLSRGADFVIHGEGELTLGELMDSLTGRGEVGLDSVHGLSFRDPATGAITSTPRRTDLKDLDSLPFPAWDLVDIPRYRDLWYRRHGYYSMNLATSRGCPFHCNWCAKPIWGQHYNVRSPDNVVAEMKWVKEAYNPDHIWFVDDILGVKPGWVQRFAGLVEERDLRMPFKSLCRVDLLLRGDTIDALKRAGAATVWVGVESGSQRVLDAMDKGTRVEQATEVARRMHEAGIEIGFFLQFGYPGETRADIERTIRLVRDCRPDDIGVSVSYPLPGTKFHSAVQKQLGTKQNWIDSNDLDMMYRGPFTTAFYRQLHTVLHEEFRRRKDWEALTVQASAVAPSSGRFRRRRAPRLRLLASVLRHSLTLPFARWRLERLAHAPHRGLEALPQIMTPQAAAQPTPQVE
jgi:anaerobic magnesium-protoporphyrin IX monomethyl ester cyclase